MRRTKHSKKKLTPLPRYIVYCKTKIKEYASSPENLVKNLELSQYKYTPDAILTHKGIYPYEYMDSFERFPPKGKFYSTLSEYSITDEEFIFAFHVYKKYECRIIGEYHDIYLKTDISSLTDVSKNFRSTCLKYYGLDPSPYLSAPNFAFDAMLKRRMLNSSWLVILK